MYEATTIAAIATAIGEGGIGIIRLSGEDALSVAEKIFQAKGLADLSKAQPRHMYYGHVMDGDVPVDEGLLVYMKGPHSYTGEDVVELQLHGSMEALREALDLSLQNGAVLAGAGEFTKRAFLNGRLDLSQAEAVMDIIEASGKAALHQAESHLSGALSQYVKKGRDLLKEMIGQLEVTIDYPEEDLEDLTHEEIAEGLSAIDRSLSALLGRSEKGRLIRDGIRTVIAGKPNAGKSSLLNALLQEERAIVTDVPGTTRDTIEEIMHIGGVPLVLMDTAGIRDTEDKVEKIGIYRAKESIGKADLILLVIDGSEPLAEEDKELLELVKDKQALIVLNKNDLPEKTDRKEISNLSGGKECISLSALSGSGLPLLEQALEKAAGLSGITAGRELFLTNLRHVEAVREALGAVRRAEESLAQSLPADCITIDLTEAWNRLGEITGDTIDDELIHTIFERFCVGK
ncbi:MAG: tRNA uridine-5-carboxymethylaminomethyl(34) synthesis GTPase MnmE [Dialister sp.]|nr:tRNA uridine-5-carboxymethylaminomethyl(34) synthesis GTPase MnmE [Dialister sp.]